MDRVTVIYDMDGTNVDVHTGHRVTTQMKNDGAAVVRIHDDEGRVAQAINYRLAYKITRECDI